MFKIGLENRDFCKSLHFYIVDAGKKKKKTSCICWLVQLLSALRAEGIARRAMPSLFFFLCFGALASALIGGGGGGYEYF